MTLRQVDEVLRSWKRKLTLIAENLVELQEDATFRSLTGTGGLQQAAVTGVTAARVQPALRMLPVIYEQFALLQSTIDRAEKLRAELPALFGGEAKGRELQSLLFGPSIQLPGRGVPLQERTLLNGSATVARSTPSELLAPMEQSFGVIRDAVSLVTHASLECLGRCDAVEQEIVRLRSHQALPSAVLAEALDGVDERLEAVREQLRTDPLGAQEELRAQIEPVVAALSAKVERASQLRQELRGARARCEEFRLFHEQALVEQRTHGWTERSAALPEAVPEETVEAVHAWLVRLEQKCEEGAVDAVGVGLRNWNSAVDRCVQQDRSTRSATLALVELRSELCGRMDALEAKAGARGLLQSEEGVKLHGVATALLRGQAADLQAAEASIAAYERFLSGTGVRPERR